MTAGDTSPAVFRRPTVIVIERVEVEEELRRAEQLLAKLHVKWDGINLAVEAQKKYIDVLYLALKIHEQMTEPGVLTARTATAKEVPA